LIGGGEEGMSELSTPPVERSRKAYSRVLQRLQEPGRGVALAASLGISETSVSRIKTERMEECLAFLYALGFKVVDQAKTCIDSSALEFMRNTTARVLSNQEQARQMFRDDE
jgi:hypothetical protein